MLLCKARSTLCMKLWAYELVFFNQLASSTLVSWYAGSSECLFQIIWKHVCTLTILRPVQTGFLCPQHKEDALQEKFPFNCCDIAVEQKQGSQFLNDGIMRWSKLDPRLSQLIKQTAPMRFLWRCCSSLIGWNLIPTTCPANLPGNCSHNPVHRATC